MADFEVHIDLQGQTRPVGFARANRARSTETVLFEYDEGWLSDSDRFSLEPALPLTRGPFAPPAGAAIFGFEAGVVKALGEYVGRGEWRGSVVFWVLAALVLIGALIGTAFVQQGYATGAAESVVGAVNVVGPLASVVFGVAVLGEGVNYTALGVALMLVSAAVSMSGVALLSRHTSAAPVSAAS